MAQLALGTAGAYVGSFFGPLGTSIGWTLGSAIGGALFGPKGPNGPRLNDLKLQQSQYGQMIPIVWGRMRGAGIVIDQTDLTEHQHSSSGKGSDGPTTYSYSASFQIAIQEGPIVGLSRIWADGRVIYDTTGGSGVDNSLIPITVYNGTETQLPDPTFEGIHGTGNVSAYRGVAYVTLTDMDLSEYGNRTPNLEFETYTHAGNIPWRVNFIPNPTTTQWWPVPSPTTLALTGAVYEGAGKVAAYVYAETDVVYYSSYWVDCFQTNISPQPDPDRPGVGRTPLPNVPHAGAPRRAGGGGTCRNYPAVYCYGSDDATQACWYTTTGPGSVVADHPDGSGGGPDGTFVFNSVCADAIYINGALYAPYANTLTGHVGIAKWGLGGSWSAHLRLNGVTPDGDTSSWKLGEGDDGNLWLAYPDSSPGTHGDGLMQLSPELGVLYHWDQSDAAHTTPAAFTVTHQFVVYKNLIASSKGLGASANFTVWDFDPTTFAITLHGSVPQHESFSIRMLNGFVLVADGIVSLDPPFLGAPLVPLYEVVGGGGPVSGLSERAGYDTTQYDASELVDLLTGFRLADQGTCRSAIETLQPAYFFDAVERDTLIAFPKRGGTSALTIPLSDLAAYEDGQNPPDPRSFTHGHEDDIPRQISVLYVDESSDYQQGSQFEQRRVGNSVSPINIQIAVAMTPDIAKNIAHVNLVQADVERDQYAFQTSRKYAYLGPTDVVTVIDKVVRINDEDASPIGVSSFKSVLTVPQIYRSIAESAAGDGFTEPTAATGQDTTAYLLAVPLLDDLDSATGFYVAMCGALDDTWRGGGLFQSKDSGSTYTQVATVATANVIGTLASTLGDFLGGNVIDEVNVMTVTIGAGGGELASCTRDALFNGANLAVVGSGSTWEALQYQRASLISTATYMLSGLRRGRRGTEWAMPLHSGSDVFISLPATPVAMLFGDLGKSFLYKAVTTGQSISDVDSVAFTNTGEALRPYPPVQVGGGINAAGDVTVDWHRRTRQSGEWQEYVDVPMTEPVEGYVVEIWNSAYTSCARIIETTTQSATYTAAQQAADFGAAQHTYYVTAAQKGSYQLGRRAKATIAGTGGSNSAPLAPVTSYNGTLP